jgi:hypothetical protein
MLTDDNVEDLELRLMQARTTISAALDRSKILEIVREITDGSTVLEFKSERARKFISAARPELLLVFNDSELKKKYPNEYARLEELKKECPKDILVSTIDPESASIHYSVQETRSIKETIVIEEIGQEIINFFAATFKYIINGEIPKGFKSQEKRVLDITAKLDREKLRNTVQGILVSDNDLRKTKKVFEAENDELGFIFSIVTSTNFKGGGESLTDPSVFLEIVY